MTDPPELPPAGWHPDPEQPNTWRYWDGSAWTDQRAPMQTPSVPAQTGSATPSQPTSGKGGKVAAWIIGGIVVVVIIAVAGGGSDDGGSRGGGGAGDSQQSNTSQAQSAQPAAQEEPEMTSGQENALQSAQDYIDLTGFSKAGLIDQLSSSAGEGFSKADATFAANNVDVDWNAEAVESAKNYLDLGGMSESALLDQLTSSAGEQFTPEQAQYAVDKVY